MSGFQVKQIFARLNLGFARSRLVTRQLLVLHMKPFQLQKWVLSFQETNACCGSKLILELNQRQSDLFGSQETGVVLQVTTWALQATSASTKPSRCSSLHVDNKQGVKNSEVRNSSGFSFLFCYIQGAEDEHQFRAKYYQKKWNWKLTTRKFKWNLNVATYHENI